MADSPGSGSPLSSHASSEFMDDVKHEDEGSYGGDGAESVGPPSKRTKLYSSIEPYGPNSIGATAVDGEISSDTDGSAPASPIIDPALTNDDDDLEQVTICRWRNCDAGDQGNMDELVKHIHEVHIPEKQKKWICEWEKCPRLDLQHASGYALRAHMRSHTKEKPFLCKLPECDRSFTRSDALLKHMRTQHETEALRQIGDTGTRSQAAASAKPQRLKLILKSNGVKENGTGGEANAQSDHDFLLDLGLTEQDLAQPYDKLYRTLYTYLKWFGDVNDDFRSEIQELEARHRYEWEYKELVFSNTVESELAIAEKKVGATEGNAVSKARSTLLPDPPLPISGSIWFRKDS